VVTVSVRHGDAFDDVARDAPSLAVVRLAGPWVRVAGEVLGVLGY